MGVRGLTTYIASNAEQYLLPHELHDCNLVIDGDNLASQLFRWISNCNSAYGGDYDQYYRTVVNVFQMFLQCGITPYVIMDGGYEIKKMNTVHSRLRAKIASIKKVNPYDSHSTFPLHMREVFLNGLKRCNIPVMRCLFEADDEIALLAQKLDCPVLSYDSDFYIHNVKYIPISTVTFKIYKRIQLDNDESEIVEVSSKVKRKSRKKILVQKVDSLKTINDEQPIVDKNYYYFMDCCLYEIDNISRGVVNLKKEMFPLLATLMGNDYIERRTFNKFYGQLSTKRTGKKSNLQQRRIYGILKWLENQTLESAIVKILGCMKKEHRGTLKLKIENSMSGYQKSECISYEYFGFTQPLSDAGSTKEINIDVENIEEVENDDGEEEEDDDVDGTIQLDETLKHFTLPSHGFAYKFPEWFQKRYLNAEFSRCFVDFLSLKLYVNVPQVENFEFEDSNRISMNILQFIYSLLQQESTKKKKLVYMTRDKKGHNVLYKVVDCLELPEFHYDPTVMKNLDLFKEIFTEFENSTEIFNSIHQIPEQYQLYFLSILYWATKSEHINPIHVHCVLLSLLVIDIIDPMIGVHRDVRHFENFYKQILIEQKTNQKTIPKESFNPPEYSMINEKIWIDVKSKITKEECISVHENCIQLFEVSSKSRTRHNESVLTIIHPFAEFQSIIFNLNNLNALLNYPFIEIQINRLFNGMFVYNSFVNLKGRSDIFHYIRYYLFAASPQLYQFYLLMLVWLKKFIPSLEATNYKQQKVIKNKKKKCKKVSVDECDDGSGGGDEETAVAKDDDDDFNDVNNKFSVLLKL